jgi:hypothetical protein
MNSRDDKLVTAMCHEDGPVAGHCGTNRPLKNYCARLCAVEIDLECEPRLGVPIKMLIYNT